MSTTVRVFVLAVYSALLVGCFDPAFKGDLACGPGASCPPGLACANDGICRSSVPIDAPEVVVPPDAAPVGCTGDADCQTAPSACLRPGVCDLAQGVCNFPTVDCSAMTDECSVGSCDPATGACVATPINEDSLCGAGVDCGAFGACGNFTGGTCDSTGERSRTCTRNACQAGACVGTSMMETDPTCTRVTADTACGPGASCGAYSDCGGFSADCDTTGTQSRTCTSATLCNGSDACMAGTSADETIACTRSQVSCTGPPVSACGACGGFGSTCDQSGTRSCTCHTYACSQGGCVVTSAPCSQACTRNTDGVSCGTGRECISGICECPTC